MVAKYISILITIITISIVIITIIITIIIIIIISISICDRLWENRPLRAQYDFSVEAFVVYLT